MKYSWAQKFKKVTPQNLWFLKKLGWTLHILNNNIFQKHSVLTLTFVLSKKSRIIVIYCSFLGAPCHKIFHHVFHHPGINIEVASAWNGVWNQNFWVGLLLTATANGQIDLMEILCLIYVHESLHILRKWLLGSKIIYKLQYSATFPARSTQKLTELYFSVCVLREAVGVVII